MSTYHYLQCRDCNDSTDDLGSSRDAPQIIHAIQHRDEVLKMAVRLRQLGLRIITDFPERSLPLDFLEKHANCRVDVLNGYGAVLSASPSATPAPVPEVFRESGVSEVKLTLRMSVMGHCPTCRHAVDILVHPCFKLAKPEGS